MSKYTFINPENLLQIQRVAAEMAAHWSYDPDLAWQVWDMVGTVMSGKAEITRFEDGGIIVEGWNSGGFHNPDPASAWGGFYRLERQQMIGTLLRYVFNEQPERRAERFDDLRYKWQAYDLIWEPQGRAWGWRGWEQFYRQEEAEARQALLQKDPRCKRTRIRHLEMIGMWVCEWETTRKPGRESRPSKLRINITGTDFSE